MSLVNDDINNYSGRSSFENFYLLPLCTSCTLKTIISYLDSAIYSLYNIIVRDEIFAVDTNAASQQQNTRIYANWYLPLSKRHFYGEQAGEAAYISAMYIIIIPEYERRIACARTRERARSTEIAIGERSPRDPGVRIARDNMSCLQRCNAITNVNADRPARDA